MSDELLPVDFQDFSATDIGDSLAQNVDINDPGWLDIYATNPGNALTTDVNQAAAILDANTAAAMTAADSDFSNFDVFAAMAQAAPNSVSMGSFGIWANSVVKDASGALFKYVNDPANPNNLIRQAYSGAVPTSAGSSTTVSSMANAFKAGILPLGLIAGVFFAMKKRG